MTCFLTLFVCCFPHIILIEVINCFFSVIYIDCPQVQVTHEYQAQQPDELNLATGEKINVLRKTADGM